MLEISTLPWDYPRRLEKLGIRCKAFAPIQPFLSTHYNYRDHRKILVIDGKVAFTGGVNLADEYINRKERFGHWTVSYTHLDVYKRQGQGFRGLLRRRLRALRCADALCTRVFREVR